MSSIVTSLIDNYSAGAPGEAAMFMRRKGQLAGEGKGVILLHGRGGNATQYAPYYNKLSPGYFAWLLAMEGYKVLSIDMMGGYGWSNAAVMDRIDDAYTLLTTTLGAVGTEVGIMGWSMGGLSSLNWIKRNKAKVAVAWLWCPATDLDFFHATAGYVPAYVYSGVTMGAYAADIDAAYPNYAVDSSGYKVRDEYAQWNNVCPIHLVHAVNDTTIPVAQSRAFVAGVNDPLVTLQELDAGGHAQLFGYITDLEFMQHFADNL